jgi:tRNA(Ile)-lysidine synthetase-like protein
LQFRSILVEKSGKGLWFFKLDSFSPLDNLYLYNASADSVRETSVIWRFRQLGDFYIVKNSCRNRRKWSKWLQENDIPNAVRDYLPLLAEGSKIIRMGCPTDFVNNNSL